MSDTNSNLEVVYEDLHEVSEDELLRQYQALHVRLAELEGRSLPSELEGEERLMADNDVSLFRELLTREGREFTVRALTEKVVRLQMERPLPPLTNRVAAWVEEDEDEEEGEHFGRANQVADNFAARLRRFVRRAPGYRGLSQIERDVLEMRIEALRERRERRYLRHPPLPPLAPLTPRLRRFLPRHLGGF